MEEAAENELSCQNLVGCGQSSSDLAFEVRDVILVNHVKSSHDSLHIDEFLAHDHLACACNLLFKVLDLLFQVHFRVVVFDLSLRKPANLRFEELLLDLILCVNELFDVYGVILGIKLYFHIVDRVKKLERFSTFKSLEQL